MKHETIGNYYKRAGDICPVCHRFETIPMIKGGPPFWAPFIFEIFDEDCPNCLGMGHVINTSKTYEEEK